LSDHKGHRQVPMQTTLVICPCPHPHRLILILKEHTFYY
jgi:hypothetical protein